MAKKKLIDIKLTIHATKNPIFIRSGLALLCAHFEGFVRQLANYYVVFVSSQNISFKLLKSNFAAIHSIKKLKGFSESEKYLFKILFYPLF